MKSRQSSAPGHPRQRSLRPRVRPARPPPGAAATSMVCMPSTCTCHWPPTRSRSTTAARRPLSAGRRRGAPRAPRRSGRLRRSRGSTPVAPPPAFSWSMYAADLPRHSRPIRASCETIRWSPTADPGAAEPTPLPKMIEHGNSGGVICTTRNSTIAGQLPTTAEAIRPPSGIREQPGGLSHRPTVAAGQSRRRPNAASPPRSGGGCEHASHPRVGSSIACRRVDPRPDKCTSLLRSPPSAPGRATAT